MSINYPTLAHYRHYRYFSRFGHSCPLCPSTTVENPLQITPFYAKQTQFPKRQNEYNHRYSKRLQEFAPLLGPKNKPNSNPNKANFGPISRVANPIQTLFQTSDNSFLSSVFCFPSSFVHPPSSVVPFRMNPKFLKFINSCYTKTPSKTDGNEVDIYLLLCHYIEHLIWFLTSEVVRRLKLRLSITNNTETSSN
jgi:hypothetical protein